MVDLTVVDPFDCVRRPKGGIHHPLTVGVLRSPLPDRLPAVDVKQRNGWHRVPKSLVDAIHNVLVHRRSRARRRALEAR